MSRALPVIRRRAVRRVVRRRADGRLVRARARESHRRAHRLQRRLRAADLDSAGDRGGGGAKLRAVAFACGAASSAPRRRCASSTSATRRPARGGWTTCRASPSPFATRASRLAVSIWRWPPTCRWAAGLSSSAALEVSVLRALRRLFGLEFDDVRLARIGRAVETDFVGAPIGIMDQMASSLAGVGEALFVDTRTLATEPVALPAATELVVINSGVAHHHAHGDYRTRRAECERAASLLGVAELRDLGVADLAKAPGAARAARSARAPCRHREPAGARRRGGDARRRRRRAGRAVRRVTRQPARRLRVLGAGGRPAGRDRAGRPGRPWRPADRRRLWRVDRRAGSRRRGRRRCRARRRRV